MPKNNNQNNQNNNTSSLQQDSAVAAASSSSLSHQNQDNDFTENFSDEAALEGLTKREEVLLF